jgi:amino acid permease
MFPLNLLYRPLIASYFVSTVTIFGSLTWISILASHVAFMRGMKAQGISRDTLPYKSVSHECLCGTDFY